METQYISALKEPGNGFLPSYLTVNFTPIKSLMKFLLMFILVTTISEDCLAQWSTASNTGSLVGNVWSPGRGSDGRVTLSSLALLPQDTWIQVDSTKAADYLEPLFVSGGYKPIGRANSMFIYSGMAFDNANGKSYMTGGGHSGGGDNGIYSVDFYKMAWEVTAYPSKPGVDLTTEETNMYISGSIGGNSYGVNVNMTGSVQVYPYAGSSTGFAIKQHNTESQWAWCEVVGPAGNRALNNVLFPNSSVVGSQAGLNYYMANYKIAREAIRDSAVDYDVLPDGRPTSRHQYKGLIYNTVTNEVQSVVRSFTRAKTDGTGWVNFDAGGYKSYPKTKMHTELIWVFNDDQTGEIWAGGCGSECYVSNYFYYSRALIYNPIIDQFSDSPKMNNNQWTSAGCQVLYNNNVFKAGRWVISPSNNPNDATWGSWGMYNMDTHERRSLQLTGPKYSPLGGEGTPFVYIKPLNQVWVFQPGNNLACAVVDLNNLTPNAVYPPETFNAPTFTKTFANSASIGPDPLLYNRLTYWEKEGLLVLINRSNQNIWVCKVGGIPTSTKENIANVKNELHVSPNPFNSTANIQILGTFNPEKASLQVFDLQGKLVADLTNKLNEKNIQFNADGLSDGIYTVKLKANEKVIVRKMVHLKE